MENNPKVLREIEVNFTLPKHQHSICVMGFLTALYFIMEFHHLK